MITTFLKKIRNWKHLDVSLLFLGLLPIFWFLVNNVGADYRIHLSSIIDINEGKSNYSPHFLFFYLVNLFSGFSSDIERMYWATILLLTMATVAKYMISKNLILSYANHFDHTYKNRVAKVLAFGLLFIFTIPDFYNFFILKYMYLGRIPPNVWHNSTITLLFPFSLLLFRQHLLALKIEDPKLWSKNTLILIVLIILNMIIKPSFLFAFFPVAGLFVLNDFQIKNLKKSLVQAFPLIIGGIALMIQYVTIYRYQVGSLEKEASSLVIGLPFEFIRHYIPYWYVPIALFFSFIFPITAIYFYRDILKYKPFVLTFLYTIVGFLIATFVIEGGTRKFHGNLTWQNIICMYLLMLTTVMYLFPKLFTKNLMSTKMLVLIGVFIVQFLSGILYFLHMYYTGGLFS